MSFIFKPWQFSNVPEYMCNEVSECVCVAESGQQRRTRHLGATADRRRSSAGQWLYV